MPEEQEAYDKVRSTLVTDHVTEKIRAHLRLGGSAKDASTQTDGAKKGGLSEMERKQLQARQNREDARIKKQIEIAHKEMARLEKYVNVNAD